MRTPEKLYCYCIVSGLSMRLKYRELKEWAKYLRRTLFLSKVGKLLNEINVPSVHRKKMKI